MTNRSLTLALAVLLGVAFAACQQSAGGSASPGPWASEVPQAITPVALPPVGQLVFDRYDSSQNDRWLGTFVISAAGGGAHSVALSVKVDGGLSAVWSRDGRRLLVNVWTPPSGPARPAIVNPDGTGLRVVDPTGIVGDLVCSAWSPDGLTLLCSISSPNPAIDGIYSVRTDGSQLTRLTVSPYHDTVGTGGECGGGDARAVLSPDGKQFGFIRQKCGTGSDPGADETGAIEIANIDGTGLREVVPLGGVRTHPGSALSWSPDGTWIAFGTQDHYLSLVHPDGTGLVRPNIDVGSAPVDGVFGPSWSPDGKWLVIGTGTHGVVGSLYMVAPDGSHLTQVSGDTTGAAFANWGPAPSS